MDLEQLLYDTQKDEGTVLFPYKDEKGFWTIGTGRCFEKKWFSDQEIKTFYSNRNLQPGEKTVREILDGGISRAEAAMLKANDIRDVIEQCKKKIDFFEELNDVRQNVLLNMCFNMGIGRKGLLGFPRFLKYLKEKDFTRASIEMLDSQWFRKTETTYKRAKRLAIEIATGEFQRKKASV